MEEKTSENNIEQQDTTTGQPAQSRWRRWVMGFIAGLLVLVAGLPLALYLPPVQDVVKRAVVGYLNETSEELTYSVGKVRIGFPLRLRVEDVDVARRSDGTPLLHVGKLQAGLDDLALSGPRFVLDKVHVEDVALDMDSLTTSLGLAGTLKQLDAERLAIDLANYRIRLDAAIADSPDLMIALGPSPPDTIDEPGSPWHVEVGRVAIGNGRVKFDMSDSSLDEALRGKEPPSPYLDYEHLMVSGIDLEAENIVFKAGVEASDSQEAQPLTVHADVNHLKAREENCGLEVTRLGARFRMEGDLIGLHDVDLGLGPDDYLQGDADVHLGLLDSLSTGFADARLEARIDSANLCRLAAPYLPGLQRNWVDRPTTLALDGRLTPDSLDIGRLMVEIPGHVKVTGDAVGQHLPDNQQRTCAATLKGSLRDADFLLSAFVDEPSKRSYRLPADLDIDLEGSQRGSRIKAMADVQQHGRDVVRADGSYDLTSEAYHLDAKVHGLNVSEFVPSVIADRMTATVLADGRHFDFPSKRTRLDARIEVDTLHFVDNTGRADSIFGLSAEASMLGGQYVADVRSTHHILQFDTHLEGIYLKDTISTRGYFNVPNLDLARLPFGLARPDLGRLGVSSTIEGYYDWDEIAHLQVKIDSLGYVDTDRRNAFDDIVIGLESSPGMMDISLIGGDANLMLCTDRSIRDLPTIIDTLMVEVNRQLRDYRFDFDALTSKVPQLSIDFQMAQQNPFYDAIVYYTGYEFRDVDIKALNAFRFSLVGNITGLINETGSVDFDTIAIDIQPDRMGYRYATHAMHIDPKASKSYDIHLGGQLMPDSITAGLTYVNGNYLTLYDVMASLAIGDDSATLHLENDPMLYEQQFTVNKDNYLSVMHYKDIATRRPNTRARIILDGPRDLNLRLYTRQDTRSQDGNQLLLLVRNLDLAYATHLMQWDGDAGGRFNLTAAVTLYPDSLGARLRSGIKTFHLGDYRADTLAFDGNLAMARGTRDVDGTLTVDSIVKLQVNADLADSVNVRGRIDDFPLPLVNAFLPSNINLWGTTTGGLTMLGKDIDHAKVNAHLAMHEAGLVYDDLDAQLRFAEDTLRLTNNRLVLNDYKLYGANRNPISVRGNVDFSKSVSNPAITLNLTGNNVRLIDNHQLRLKDQYITGRLGLTPSIRVRGTLAKLDVGGSLRVLSGTNLNYYMSEDPLSENSKIDDIVEFVSFRQQDREMALAGMRRRPPMQDQNDEGLNVGLRIEIDRDVKVTAHLEGTDNNKVDIVGGGSLNLQTDNQGEFVMSGTYDIMSGKVDYKLPILPMVKTFDINSSSLVNWDGSAPGDPVINILATEDVKATVNVDNQTRLVNFLVSIAITGTLEKLQITFDCSAPNDGAINSELVSLTDDDRSKIGLMLLISQTYLGPGSSSSAGLGTANAALSSMLNRQLESLIGNMKGTTIDIGVDTYNTETGSARTDYSVKVTKTLFNDRVRASIGGQVSSGAGVNQEGAQIGDMSLEWLIKKDGTHYLKIYRVTNYESVLEGEVVESGISHIEERSGYRFRQLLLPTSRKRRARIEEHIRELQRREEEEERQAREKTENNETTESEQPAE